MADFLAYLATLLTDNVFIGITVVDFLFKSAILVLLFKYAEQSLFPYLASSHKHKLWLAATVLLGLLPFSSLLSPLLFEDLLSSTNLTFITILVPMGMATKAAPLVSQSNNWFSLASLAYFAILALLLFRLGAAYSRIVILEKTADFNVYGDAKLVLGRIAKALEIKRNIKLGISNSTHSPITFGVMKPVVILPRSFNLHDTSLLENVLTHELAHIKRLDWLTSLLGYLLASASWFNPFVWRALKNLRLEAEFACDNTVIARGAHREDFAQQLLLVARKCVNAGNQELVASAAIRQNDLALRIENILGRDDFVLPDRKVFNLLSLLYIPLFFVLISVGNIFAIEDESKYASEALRLIHSEMPVYPDWAFAKGIEGFARYSFTVDEHGYIDQATIRLELSEPEYLFNQASRDALSSFRFQPRKVNGKPSVTPGVKYSFNYRIQI